MSVKLYAARITNVSVDEDGANVSRRMVQVVATSLIEAADFLVCVHGPEQEINNIEEIAKIDPQDFTWNAFCEIRGVVNDD